MCQFDIIEDDAALLLYKVRSMWEEPTLDWKVGFGELFAHCRELTLKKSSKEIPLRLLVRLYQAVWWAFESIPVISGMLFELQCSTNAVKGWHRSGVLRVISI